MNSNKKSKARKSRSKNRAKNRQLFKSVAPVAVSDDIQQSVSFGAGNKEGSLRLKMTIPLYQISSGATQLVTSYPGGLVSTTDPSSSFVPATSVQLGIGEGIRTNNALSYPYLSPASALLSNAFVRYEMIKLKFIYEPQAPTTIQDRIVFAFAEDPRHPLFYTPDVSLSNSMTQGKLLALSDSIAFAPWKAWSMDVTKSLRKDPLYTALEFRAPDGSNPLLPTERFACFGSIGCATSSFAGASFVEYGVLYAQMEVDLFEFCPIVQTAVVPIPPGEVKDCDDKTCPRCTRVCKHESEEVDDKMTDTRCLVKSLKKK